MKTQLEISVDVLSAAAALDAKLEAFAREHLTKIILDCNSIRQNRLYRTLGFKLLGFIHIYDQVERKVV